VGKTVLGLTMSLDGFVADRDGSVGLLYADFQALQQSDLMRQSIKDTGAVIMGWNAYAMADDPDLYADHYEFQVPIFVLTHAAPQRLPKQSGGLTFTFVTDGIESAHQQARMAAGDRDVVVIGGASTARHCIRAGLADELHIDIMPVLMAGGLRLFDDTGAEPPLLERLSVVALPSGRTHLRFRVAA
jgi:dihydrofolate reductase